MHLLPKLLGEHGLTPANLHLPETVMEYIIERCGAGCALIVNEWLLSKTA